MVEFPQDQGQTRRGLLGSLVGGLGLAAVAPWGKARAAAGQTPVSWSLRAVSSTYTFPDGAALPFYRLEHPGAGTTHGHVPLLEAVEGQVVQLTVDNRLPIAIRPALIGVAEGPFLRPGQSGTFTFSMPPAGSYLIGRGAPTRAGGTGRRAYDLQRPASGFAALVVSRPSSGLAELWNGGPSFDREYFLLYEDADERFNATMATAAGPLPAVNYEPNYFMLNGLAYPDIAADGDSVVSGLLGGRILIRMGNLGRMRQSIHFHGFHPEVVARDNVHETVLGEKDTVPLPWRTTVDLILTANQRGDYPLHPHSLTAVTANGFYPMGQLSLISIS